MASPFATLPSPIPCFNSQTARSWLDSRHRWTPAWGEDFCRERWDQNGIVSCVAVTLSKTTTHGAADWAQHDAPTTCFFSGQIDLSNSQTPGWLQAYDRLNSEAQMSVLL